MRCIGKLIVPRRGRPQLSSERSCHASRSTLLERLRSGLESTGPLLLVLSLLLRILGAVGADACQALARLVCFVVGLIEAQM
jgi:hypothetical protein